MSDHSKIEWTEATWNCVTGCTKVSPGCDHCYAETFAERWRGIPGHHFEQGFDVKLWYDRLEIPRHWKRGRRIFVNSMSDVFHEAVPDEFIMQMFAVMAVTPQHSYQVLTKRHGRMRSLLSRPKFADDVWSLVWQLDGHSARRRNWPLRNVWLGVSVEDQQRADLRIPALLATPAATRFLSCEPLIGPVDLRTIPYKGNVQYHLDVLNRRYRQRREYEWGTDCSFGLASLGSLHWVIAGGESGPGARPCELDWIEQIVNACHEARVPIFVKQLGSTLGRKFSAGTKGGDIDRWPPYLQHRHFPETAGAAA